MQLRILVKVYKENFTIWYPTGETRNISCNHMYLGIWGINMQAEEVPIPSTTIPPEIGTGESNQSAQAIIPIGNVYVDSTYFGDSNFKVCVKVKDMDTGIVSFIDATDYANNIGKCNLVPVTNFCPLVTGITAGSITSSGATLSWTAVPGSDGVEYINNTSGTTPVINGTFIPSGTNSQVITGLSTGTTYHFWIRTLCPGGKLSAWTFKTYVTS